LAFVVAILIYAAYHVLPYYPSTPVSKSALAVDPGRLHASGRIYLVQQMGPHREDAYNLALLAEWLRDKYGVDARVLSPMDLGSRTENAPFPAG